MPVLPATRHKAVISFIIVTCMLDIIGLGIIIPVFPQLVEEFAGSNAEAGWLNGVFIALWAAMQFVASPIIGSLSDQYGRRPVILLSCAGLGADYMLMALAPNLWWLVLGRIINGVTTSSFTTAFAYMADITPPQGRARAYGLIGAAFSGGFVIGPLIGGLLGEYSPRAPFWFAAALSAVAFLYGLFILPESLRPEARMKFSWVRANPFGAMKLLARHPELAGLAVVNFLLYFSHHVFSAVFVLYAGYRYGWGPWQVGALLALVGILDMSVQALLVGRAVKQFGDRPVMAFGLFGGAIGIAWMGLAPTGLMFILAMVPNALWGLAMPTLQALMTSHVSESEQGQLQGATASVASIAGIASPLFFGAVYSYSLQPDSLVPFSGTAFLIASLVLLGAALIGWVVARRAERAEQPA
jgi:MFS transporter, DHA1 family, tetracycline resistance protein